MSNLAQERRAALIAELRRWGHPQVSISDGTDLTYDLGIAGDDLEDVLTWVHERFNVDFSAVNGRDFNLNEPPSDPFTFFGRRRRFKSMTVGGLLSAIESGVWVTR